MREVAAAHKVERLAKAKLEKKKLDEARKEGTASRLEFERVNIDLRNEMAAKEKAYQSLSQRYEELLEMFKNSAVANNWLKHDVK